MTTRGNSSSIFFLSVAAFVIALVFLQMPASAQNVQVDLSSTSGLCGGQQCFNADGLFSTGTTFLGTAFMDGSNAGNCTPPPQFSGCPDAYSASAAPGLGLSSSTPPTLTPPSLNVPFVFGPVNTTNCGSTGVACVLDVVNLTNSGVVITLPTAEQTIYSTIIMLGTAVNGNHKGKVTATYTDGTTNVFLQTFSDWCGFSSNQYESIAVGGINRIDATGTLNHATCNLYAYTYPVDFTRILQSITLTDADGSGAMFALAITLKPPTYTVDAGVPTPTSVAAGSTATATVTVNPQPGYVGSIQLSCSISPTIQSSSTATAPTCSLSPTSVDVTADETSAPTTTLTFTAAKPAQARVDRDSGIFYALWLPVPGLALLGFGFRPRSSRRRKLFRLLMLSFLLATVVITPGCVTYKHLGNVGTPPGQYTVSITGVDSNGLTQASNPIGTTNTVVLTVSN